MHTRNEHACTHTHTHTLQDIRKSVGQVQSTLVKKLSILDKYEHVLAQVNAVSMERLIDPKTQVNIQEVCEHPTVLAQQLTHIEMVGHHLECFTHHTFITHVYSHTLTHTHIHTYRRDSIT